jgi:AraC-like DNA-binding protein
VALAIQVKLRDSSLVSQDNRERMSQIAAFSTSTLPPPERASAWTRTICRSYFPLDLSYRDPERFTGSLRRWTLGNLQASCLTSEAAMYRRRREHLREIGEEDFLLTIPCTRPVSFLQMGREVTCAPGGFILERGNEPYVFSYEGANRLIVAKISGQDIEARLPDPGRYCAMSFDAGRGVGALLSDMIRLSERRAPELSEGAGALIGQQIMDLLALAVEADPRAIRSGHSTVRRAHIRRIDNVIAERFADPALSPACVAAICDISLRYLHDLCRSDGVSFRERLRRARLEHVRAALLRPGEPRSITELSFAAGFPDTSSFSRAYRAEFGESPRDTKSRVMPQSG